MPIDLSPDHLFSSFTFNLNDILPRIWGALVTLGIGLLVIRLLSILAKWLLGFIRMPRGLRGIVSSLIDSVLTAFLVIIVLQSLGLNNLAFAFSAGIAALGLALGSGSATFIQDVLAGIFLARDTDFSLGDLIRIADKPGDLCVEGTVEAMDMRRTRIRDDKGNLHVFPNSYIERREWVLVAKKRERKA